MDFIVMDIVHNAVAFELDCLINDVNMLDIRNCSFLLIEPSINIL